MKLHHTKYKDNYKRFILSTIETDINGEPIAKYIDKVDYLFKRFYSEYGFMIPRVGKQKAIAEWLSGLALDLPFYYNDIDDRIDNGILFQISGPENIRLVWYRSM